MRNYEKKVKAMLSDESLVPRDSFKRKLKRDMLHTKAPVSPVRRWAVVSALSMVLVLGAVAGFQLLSDDQRNFARDQNPFSAKSVSAKELIRKLGEFPKTLGESGKSFMIQKYSTDYGPSFDWCGDQGVRPENRQSGRGDNYYYNDKNSGHEAMYNKYTYSSGKIASEQMYYSSDAEELLSASTGAESATPYLDGENYMIAGQPTFLIVDKDGNQVKDDTLYAKKVDGRDVYEFYVRENTAVTRGDVSLEYNQDGSPSCSQPRLFSQVTVDIETNIVTESVLYVDTSDPENRVMTSTFSVELKDLNERAALKAMSDAGFVKEKASDEIPVGKDNF